jgi:hypothetical protein
MWIWVALFLGDFPGGARQNVDYLVDPCLCRVNDGCNRGYEDFFRRLSCIGRKSEGKSGYRRHIAII